MQKITQKFEYFKILSELSYARIIGIVFKRPEIYTLLFLIYLQLLIFKKGVLPKFHCTVPGISIGTKKARSTGARIGFAIEILFLQAVATHWFCKRTAGP